MNHTASVNDLDFRDRLEAGQVDPDEFHHREHLRLAYTCLCEAELDEAYGRVRSAIMSLLQRFEIDVSKYHETLTIAWLQAVRHFMIKTTIPCTSAKEFINGNPMLLDTGIMLSHYSKEALFSDEARKAFVDPDLEPIPE